VSVTAEIESLEARSLEAIGSLSTEADLERLRVEVLGRKGALTAILRGLKDAPPAERPAIGERANAAKRAIEDRLESALTEIRVREETRRLAAERVDVTVPSRGWPRGRRHPLRQAMEDAIDILERMGFEVAEGPEIEDDEHNFEALNFAPDHPARDMQDTFLVPDGRLLRTHCTPIQIHVMRRRKPPLAVITPGTTYRRDDLDLTHAPMFHQIDCFLVDSQVSFAELKGFLTEFLTAFFGDVRLRFRASYFPFVEPGAEVDIECAVCRGSDAGCRVCKGAGWLEILGAGMIHPNVLRAVGYDADAVSGFAFGLGVERLAMLRHAIDDIRLFTENDLRFLRQF
jgi:phenylalanyl-tRNA synthetase alpha chain